MEGIFALPGGNQYFSPGARKQIQLCIFIYLVVLTLAMFVFVLTLGFLVCLGCGLRYKEFGMCIYLWRSLFGLR